MKRITSILVFLTFLGFSVMSQEIQISGKVTNASDGSVLPGVSVVVKGTTQGTTTNVNGEFTINAPADATLIFSFIGMKTKEVSVAGQTQMNVSMETEATGLEEVVVTALGISKEKKSLGYSVQEVSSDDFVNDQNTNLLNSLGGRVAGVQVTNTSGAAGGGSYMVIRGQASLTRDNQPLFVIDGVPIDNSQDYSGNPDNGRNNLNDGVAYSNRAMDLNSNDIASVSILKGGAATALYGLRAANGVIIITTKKGTSTQGKLNVSVSSSVAVDKVNKLPPLQNKFAQGYDGEWYGPEYQWSSMSWGPRIDTTAWDGSAYDWDRNGRIVSENDPSAKTPAHAYDNVGDFFKTGITVNNDVSFSGGTDVANFYASIGNTRVDGVVPNNDWSKTSLLIKGESKIGKKFKIEGSANYITSGGDRIQQGSNLSGVMLGLLRTSPSFDNSNGYSDPVNTPAAYQFEDGSQRNYRGGVGYDNPFWTVNKNKFNDNVNRLIGYVGFSYNPNTWLSVKYKLGTDFYSDRRHYYFAIGSGQNPIGQVVDDNHFNQDINSDLLVNINKNIGADWNLNLTLGNNMYSTRNQQLYVEGNELTIPDFYHISNASSYLQRETDNKKHTAAFFGDMGISYKDMLFLNGTFREEWSTTLSIPGELRPFSYPSVNASFVFTQLPFLQGNSILSFGKIRAAYAKTAYDATVYSTKDVYNLSAIADGWTITGLSYPFGTTSGFTFNDVALDPNIKPESSINREIGFDIRFLNGRIGADFAYYDNLSKDLLLTVPLEGTSGYNGKYTNAGTMENKGVEITGTVVPIKTQDLVWNISVNFTKNNNMVKELAPGVDNVDLGGFTGSTIRAVAGEPYGNIYTDSWLRYDGNGDGKITQSDPKIIIEDPNAWNYGHPTYSAREIVVGNVQPKWLMGISTDIYYKGFSLSALLDIRKGGDIWNGTRGALDYMGMSKETESRETATKVFDGVLGTDVDNNLNLIGSGATNTISVPLDQSWYIDGEGSGFTGPAEQFVEDGGWVRLKEVTVSYDFSKSLLQNSFLKNGATLYFTGRNLWLKTDYTGVDPETSLYGAHNAQGIDYFNMPGTKSYIVGVRFSF